MNLDVSGLPSRTAVGDVDLAQLCAALRVTPDQLRAIATLMEDGEPTLREAFARIESRLPTWLAVQQVSIRRLLDGEAASIGPGGASLPAIEGLGDLPVGHLNDRGRAHIEQVHARVGTQRLDADRACGRVSRSLDVRDVGHGAAQHSLDLTRRVAAEIERSMHINMPIRDLCVPFRQRKVHGFSPAELRAWEPLLLGRRDPVLDRVVLATALSTGARSSALGALRLADLDPVDCRVWFTSKGDLKQRYWVPLRRSLILQIRALARQRGARTESDPALLRTPARDGGMRPLTRRYWDSLWKILKRTDAPEPPHAHRLRHTTNDRVYRACGPETAVRFLDHAASGGARTNHRYLDEGEMPDDLFLDHVVEAFGPYDDCPMPVDFG